MTKWRIVIEPDPETGDWAAWCPELSGCVSAGNTEEEALQNIHEAIALYLEPSDITNKLSLEATIKEITV